MGRGSVVRNVSECLDKALTTPCARQGREMTLEEILTPLAFQGVAGFLCGLAAGYALKKIGKALAVVFGVFVLALMYLEYKDIITVHYDKLFSITESYLTALMQMQSTALTTAVSHIPLAASFTVGFATGFKKG